MYAIQAIVLVSQGSFRPLTESDYESFAGAGPEALIAEVDDYTVVLDGDAVQVYQLCEPFEWWGFEMIPGDD